MMRPSGRTAMLTAGGTCLDSAGVLGGRWAKRARSAKGADHAPTTAGAVLAASADARTVGGAPTAINESAQARTAGLAIPPAARTWVKPPRATSLISFPTAGRSNRGSEALHLRHRLAGLLRRSSRWARERSQLLPQHLAHHVELLDEHRHILWARPRSVRDA